MQFGLDKPKWEQYLIYLRELFHGNMGISFATQQPVSELLRDGLKNTIPMVTLGTLGRDRRSGIATGVLSAWRRGTAADHASTNLAIAFYSFPTQWLGLMLLILLVGVAPEPRDEEPVPDRSRPRRSTRLRTSRGTWSCPSLTLRAHPVRRVHADHAVRDARDARRGLRAHRARQGPAGPEDRRPGTRCGTPCCRSTTLIALSLGYIVAGAILIETVFSWPGIGHAVYAGGQPSATTRCCRAASSS